MRIIAFVGMPGSGKSIAASIVRELNIPIIAGGDLLRKEIQKREMELNDENVGQLANSLRREMGLDAIAKMCIAEINKLSVDTVVIDGIRNIEEIDTFKHVFGDDFYLIGIDAPFEIRYERLKNRSRVDDIISSESLKKRDEREISWGLENALKIANVIVCNTTSINDFKSKIRSTLSDNN